MTATTWGSNAPLCFTITGRLNAKDDTARAEANTMLGKFSDGSISTGDKLAAWNAAIAMVAQSRNEREIDNARELLLDLFERDV